VNPAILPPTMRIRTLGRAWLGPAFDYLLFLRPRQWPILTIQLAVGVLMAPACVNVLTGAGEGLPAALTLRTLFVAWLAWVVCLNGGTLAFNSAYDRDTADIAYLRQPPPPPPHLALFSLCLMLCGAGLAMTVAPAFGFVTAFCLVLSMLYSHPRTRWKGMPGLDLAVNMVGYGAGTTLAGILAGTAAYAGMASADFRLASSSWLLIVAFGLLFGSFYPLTQIYQLADDRARGDRTLVTALGIRRSLLLAAVLAMGANLCLLLVNLRWVDELLGWCLGIMILVMCAWLGLILDWYVCAPGRSAQDHERGMYWALALWALYDLAILLCRYSLHLFSSN